MSAELATIDGEIIEDAPRAPLNLFGTDDPVDVVARATVMADALADVIRSKGLSTHIGNRDHIQVGGWTLLGSMLGVFAEVVWSRPIEGGWEARAVARTLSGAIVGASEAMCTRKERTWGNRDDYALRSMAQTRAVSKALRLPLGFIVELAGYSATPLEEVEPMTQPEQRGPAKAAPTPNAAPVRTPEEQMLLDMILAAPGMTHARMSLLADAVGVVKGERANADQLREMLARIETPPGVPTEAADGEAGAETLASPDLTMDDVLEAAGPGSEEVPPAPGSDAFKALDSKGKLAARVHHQTHSEEVAV